MLQICDNVKEFDKNAIRRKVNQFFFRNKLQRTTFYKLYKKIVLSLSLEEETACEWKETKLFRGG